MNLLLLLALFVILNWNNFEASNIQDDGDGGQCMEKQCETKTNKYTAESNHIFNQIQQALDAYKPCTDLPDDPKCECHSDIIHRDLKLYPKISKQMLDEASKYGTRYKIYKNHLYRSVECMFPSRCSGIEYFLLRLLPRLPDMDLVVNTRDWPQTPRHYSAAGPVFSFSKTDDYKDIMYPAWTFWAGGPAISLHPTGIGRWDLMRASIPEAANKTAWSQKRAQAFFRGSRTSDERDSLVLLSRSQPALVDAHYTKNQAWKSPKDTLNAEPAKEVSFEDHCRYKYLFNFRGVAASFRLKHLFLCKSLVFHVGNEWQEFFYGAMRPWVHYVPLSSYPTQKDIDETLKFFQEHDDVAREIAERGFQLIWNHLRMEDVECYWEKLLNAYAKLLNYKVTGDKELVEIKGPRK